MFANSKIVNSSQLFLQSLQTDGQEGIVEIIIPISERLRFKGSEAICQVSGDKLFTSAYVRLFSYNAVSALKYHAIMTCRRVEVVFHAFLASALGGGVW